VVAFLVQLLLLSGTPVQSLPPVEGTVERPDVQLHYRIYGRTGPAVVILAGGPGGATAMLQPIADHLESRFRCVMLEQRGTDRSTLTRYDSATISFDGYIADIEALRIALAEDRIILVGSSWGMTLAFAYAGAHPDYVLALATIGSGTLTPALERAWADNLEVRLSEDQRQRLRAMAGKHLSADEGYVEWFRIVGRAYFYNPEQAATFINGVKVGDLNGRIPGPAAQMMRRVEEYTVDRMQRISSPVLLIQGRQDLAPEETAFIVRDRVKGSKIVLLDKCGHVPWLDQPAATWKELDAFLATVRH
jgi:proline iminopeptidase